MKSMSAKQLRSKAEKLRDKVTDLEASFMVYKSSTMPRDRKRRAVDAMASKARKYAKEAGALAKAAEKGKFKVEDALNVKGSIRRLKSAEKESKIVESKAKALRVG